MAQPSATPSELSDSATPMSATAIDYLPPLFDEGHELVIRPRKGWIGVDWSELFYYRELLFFLVWRDIKVRYKQAVLGFGWAVLQPLIQVILFSLIFGRGLKLNTNLPVPFPIFVYAGVLAWQLFATALNSGGLSLVNQQHLLTKIYFPRLFVPTAAIGGALFDMCVSGTIFVILMAIYRVTPSWTIVFLPLLLLLLIMLSTGVAYLLSALTVTYRDFRFLIPFITQIWMWTTFVAFPVQPEMVASPKWQLLFRLNPMFGIVSGFRRVLLGLDQPRYGWDPRNLFASAIAAVSIFVLGLFYFRRTERRFADIA